MTRPARGAVATPPTGIPAVATAKTWLTTADVAERSQRAVSTVRLAAGVDLHGHQSVRAGRQLRKGKWLFHLAAVDAWICGLDIRAQTQRCGCAAVVQHRPRLAAR